MLRTLIAAAGVFVLTVCSALAGGTSNSPVSSLTFDFTFGSTVGGMLCRTSSGWTLQATGTAGQVLTAQSGACPAWATPATASGSQSANLVFAGPASGSAAAPAFRALVPADEPAAADGCIRMSVSSTTVLAFNPYGCNTLNIGGVPRVVTATTLTPSSPAASTLYYAYASWSGTAVTYALSTTGHITGADGREYLSSGGATPSAVTTSRLVGMLYTNASGQFVDSTAWRGCLNWFNRFPLLVDVAANNQINSSTTTNPQSFGAAVSFLTWANDVVAFPQSGNGQPNTSGAVISGYPGLDGSSVGIGGPYTAPSANSYGNISNAPTKVLSEGAHSLQNFGSVNTGSAIFNADLNALIRG